MSVLLLPGARPALLGRKKLSLPTPSQMYMASRLNLMGFGGIGFSNGTDREAQTRLAFWNDTGAAVSKLKLIYPNWSMDATAETAGLNAITVSALVEYPAATFNPVLFDNGLTTKAIAVDPNEVTQEITLSTPIPADAQAWVWTLVQVGATEKWPRGYVIRTANGEKSSSNATPGTLTLGVDFTNTGTGGFGPVGIVATGFTGTPRKVAVVVVGDSLPMGSGDSPADGTARGSVGFYGKAAAGRCPLLNMGISGHTARFNVASASTRRLDLASKAAFTICIPAYGTNDLGASRTQAQILADLQNIGNAYAALGLLVAVPTLTPKTTSTDSWQTEGNQTAAVTPAGAWDGGASSRRSLANVLLRAKPAPFFDCIEVADAIETARDSGIWIATSARSPTHLAASGTNAQATNDGLHPVSNSTTPPGTGGVYVLKDALAAKFDAWNLL